MGIIEKSFLWIHYGWSPKQVPLTSIKCFLMVFRQVFLRMVLMWFINLPWQILFLCINNLLLSVLNFHISIPLLY